ncbi:MAG TPA: hypothetical protein VGO43_07130 [Pyrinomonadaceae bacterium]|jgi:predicted GH43/DUF377 family glycosyl hydrolase|nr:hypothetical protein [Pyrinomonadaceae bacterium]
MKWNKKGLIYGPDGDSWWAQKGALQPTPLLRSDGSIRVFVGMRTREGVSRVGYVDVSANDPSQVLDVSREPVLDIGIPGAFDENGVVPCAIIERDDKLYLYYAGYQLGQRVKFYVFGGLAISSDGGETFERYSDVPICDRTDDELFFRVIHTMMYENGRWRAWYGGGSEFTESAEGRQLPSYNIRHAESADGVTLRNDYTVCVDMNKGEYRVGRPYVLKKEQRYLMFYGAGTEADGYRLTYAESVDGLAWQRKHSEVGIDVSSSGWDSEMQAYPAVIITECGAYLFYNGNNYGETGFGYAELETW